MKSSYYRKLDPVSLAVIDLTDPETSRVEFTGPQVPSNTYMINRINVPRPWRGKGVASELLQECLADADAEEVPLILEVSSSDGLNWMQLHAWYTRYGFKPHILGPSHLLRLPGVPITPARTPLFDSSSRNRVG